MEVTDLGVELYLTNFFRHPITLQEENIIIGGLGPHQGEVRGMMP